MPGDKLLCALHARQSECARGQGATPQQAGTAPLPSCLIAAHLCVAKGTVQVSAAHPQAQKGRTQPYPLTHDCLRASYRRGCCAVGVQGASRVSRRQKYVRHLHGLAHAAQRSTPPAQASLAFSTDRSGIPASAAASGSSSDTFSLAAALLLMLYSSEQQCTKSAPVVHRLQPACEPVCSALPAAISSDEPAPRRGLLPRPHTPASAAVQGFPGSGLAAARSRVGSSTPCAARFQSPPGAAVPTDRAGRSAAPGSASPAGELPQPLLKILLSPDTWE